MQVLSEVIQKHMKGGAITRDQLVGGLVGGWLAGQPGGQARQAGIGCVSIFDGWGEGAAPWAAAAAHGLPCGTS